MKSNEGPKIAVADVNGMEWKIFVGIQGSSGSLFIQNKSGFYLSKKSFRWDKESEDTGFFLMRIWITIWIYLFVVEVWLLQKIPLLYLTDYILTMEMEIH